MKRSWRFGLWVTVLTLGGLMPATASAATINFKVVNSKGVSQAQVRVQSPTQMLYGNGAGEIAVSGLNPGNVVYFTRQLQPTSDPCVAAPEGSPGVSYTVPNPAPSSATVTLPALTFQPFEPGLSTRERGLVGLINDARRAHGLEPLAISTVLETASDGYLAYAPTAPGASSAAMHCSLYGIRTRVVDAGYPVASSVGENIVWAASATQAFEWWMSSPVHRENILNPNWTSIGLSNRGSTWLADFATTDPAFISRAGWTGDYGDASLADGATNAGSDIAGKVGSRHPRLAIKVLRLRGHQLRVKLGLSAAAAREGRVLLDLRHGRQRLRLPLKNLEARRRLACGRWMIEARFEHGAKREFESKTVTRRVRVTGAGRG